ncbi:Sec-independent protein translocase protein TatB [Gordonia crocea]|uniref:Sec-independent protein translocase protein TatB n=1 Tax=Gordonia crocea TaxID=589162 RepID=A0A7I9UW18_9ACTN|nr:Sec-independent protein translocase protein TatB [Gordonia crocea]GED97397.1 sec-independent protein translocase protein TatB [Gordonia crocea]
MFNLGWGEILVLVAAALIILGPERLPGAISSSMRWLKQAREYATGATAELREELGSDFDEFREPLQQLNELRSTSPRALVTKHLLGGDDSLLDPKTYTALPGREDPPLGSAIPDDDEGGAPRPSSGGTRHNVTDWDAT